MSLCVWIPTSGRSTPRRSCRADAETESEARRGAWRCTAPAIRLGTGKRNGSIPSPSSAPPRARIQARDSDLGTRQGVVRARGFNVDLQHAGPRARNPAVGPLRGQTRAQDSDHRSAHAPTRWRNHATHPSATGCRVPESHTPDSAMTETRPGIQTPLSGLRMNDPGIWMSPLGVAGIGPGVSSWDPFVSGAGPRIST